MATRKKTKAKTKTKTKAKRKKTQVSKAVTRRKTASVKKKPAKKTPVRRASPKKPRSTAKASVKATPARPPAPPVAAPPMPSPPAQPAPPEERIGVVTHYYSHLSVATLRLESGTLRVGDVIHIRGHTTRIRPLSPAERSRQFWATHETRVRAITFAIRAKWARLAQQKRG